MTTQDAPAPFGAPAGPAGRGRPAALFLGVCDALFAAAGALCAALFLASVLILTADIAARALFNVSTSWAAEVVRYLIVWMVFLGSGIAARGGAHIAIRVLAELLGPRAARIFDTAMLAVGMAAGAALAVFGWRLVEVMMGFSQVSPAAKAPMWTVYLSVPLGGALMALGFLAALIELWGPGAPEKRPTAG